MAISSTQSHCFFCGTAFPDARAPFPRSCQQCHQISYLNPKPVGVVIIPVEGKGVLLIQRNLPDGKGKWALPGGYLEIGESWQEGSARELAEETGIQIAASDLHLYDLISSPDGKFLLLFSIGPQISLAEVPSISPDQEVSGFMVASSPTELAFPIHSRVLERFLTLRLE